MADMTEADWLTETQVRDYWKRCTAQKRYNTPEPTVEQLEDYQNLLNARSHSKLADNIQKRRCLEEAGHVKNNNLIS